MQVLAPSKDWSRYVAQAELVARSDGFQVLRDQILERAKIGPEKSIADIGAGTGLLTLGAAELAKSVWAIDISPRMCAYLSTKARSAGASNVEAVVAPAVSLPLVTGSVDVVISIYCLHHLARVEKRAALAEIHRILRPGGRVVFADTMFTIGLANQRDRESAGAWRLLRSGARFLVGRSERPASGKWWKRELAAAGFSEIKLELSDEGGIVEARR